MWTPYAFNDQVDVLSFSPQVECDVTIVFSYDIDCFQLWYWYNTMFVLERSNTSNKVVLKNIIFMTLALVLDIKIAMGHFHPWFIYSRKKWVSKYSIKHRLTNNGISIIGIARS